MPTITCTQLRHVYRNGVVALDDVDLEIGSGITGIVGLNGAGKSTLLGVLLGALTPTSGLARIDGLAPDVYRTRFRAGYVTEIARFEGHLRVREFLDGLAALCGTGTCEPFGCDAFGGRRLDQLSQGQRRRVEVAAALTGSAGLLLLDEPTNGLDPLGLRELRDILLALRRPGVSVLVSSHHLDELERIVDRVVLMRRGRIAGVHARAELLAKYGSFDEFGARLSPGGTA